MPFELQIIRAAEFIRINSHGDFDLAGSCDALASIAQACKRRGVNRALVDARNARANLTPTEIASLVNVFREIGFSKDLHLAILHSAERYQRPRLFAFISRMKGWHVEAFDNFEGALNWLSAGQPQTQPESIAPSKPRIHVTHRRSEPKQVPIKPHSDRKNHHRYVRGSGKRETAVYHNS